MENNETGGKNVSSYRYCLPWERDGVIEEGRGQGVTKRGRLYWLTNSAIAYMSPNAEGERGSCGSRTAVRGASKIKVKNVNKKRTDTVRRLIIF
jgi:hypothetical protein